MKRLVYSPKVYAYVKTDTGIYDLTEYITSGGVNRKLDQVSDAELTIRNPYKKWTDHLTKDPTTGEQLIEPIFHPMDPITIICQRLQNHPVQVFTGFLDSSPYIVMRPDVVTLKASCTLKKLEYTYYDPGLPFFDEFMAQQGWNLVEGVGVVNQEKAQGELATKKGTMTDSGFGRLLLAVMEDIGGWPGKTLFIEKIPPGLVTLVTRLFEEQSAESKEGNEEIIKLLHKIIGTAALGEGELSTATGTPEGNKGTHPVEGKLLGAEPYTSFCEQVSSETGLSLRVMGAWAVLEGGPVDNPLNIGPGDHFGTAAKAAEASSKNMASPLYEETHPSILGSIGGTDQEQIHAIAISPWCGEAGYEELILGVYNTRIKVQKE